MEEKWRENLNPEKRSLMMKWAREYASKQYQIFKQRRIELRKAKSESDQIRQRELEKKNAGTDE